MSEHSCALCQGHECALCGEKCAAYEPPALLCHGTCGQKVRRDGLYHVTRDGSRLWCHKCYLGLKSVIIDQIAGLAPEQLGSACPGDCLVAVSFEPYAPATVELVAHAATRSVPIVAITDSPFSPLSPHAGRLVPQPPRKT